jgi:mono/diheme cytochrome c family protein
MQIMTGSTVLGVLFAVTAAQAQDIGNIRQGLQLARDVCGACHAVRAGETRSPLATAPSFESIAKTPGMTVAALAFWLTAHSHPTMPNLILSSQQLRDVSAYILSLRD